MAQRVFQLYALAGTLLAAGYFVVPRDGDAHSLWYFCVGLGSVFAILIGARVNGTRAVRAWQLVALGQLLFVCGDAVNLAYSVLGWERPSPSSADILQLAGYPAIGAGLLLMVQARSPGRDKTSLIDAAIATAGVAFYSWTFLIEPYLVDGSLPGQARVVPALYPLLDIALIAVAAHIVVGSFRFMAFSMIGLALVLQLAGDSLQLLGSIKGWQVDASSLELFPVLAYLAWGLAALHPSMANITNKVGVAEEELTARRLALLTLATLVTPLLMLEQSLQARDFGIALMVVASTTLFALVIARFASVVTRHDRAKRREELLRQAAAALVSTRSRSGIYRIAVDTALVLSEAEGTNPQCTYLSLDGPNGMTLVDAAGANIDDLVERPIGTVPPELDVQLLQGLAGSISGPSGAGPRGLVEGEHLTVYPLLIQGEHRGGLWIQTRGPQDATELHGLQTLAAQLGLALESVLLTEDLLERESERRFRRLVQNSTDVIVVLESDLTIRFATPSTKTILGYESTSLIGTSLVALLRSGETEGLIELVAGLAGKTAEHDLELRGANGGWLSFESVWNDLSQDPEVGGVVVTAHDVTNRLKLEDQLTHQAFHDPLTGLANRALLTDRVTHALDRSRRSGEQLAVLFIDLDDFKTVNDSLGHATGDELLVGVADRLAKCLRNGDTCSRLGGDEFGVLLEGVRPADEAEEVAARITEALQVPFTAAGNEVYARASIGVALGSTADGADELLRHADIAMYRAKADPSTSIAVFEAGMQEAAIQRLELRSDLERSVADGDFIVHYQPIFALESGRVVGLEALVRWEHPTRGQLQPDTFVPLAEETGLIGRIGAAVLREACHTVACWQRAVPGAAQLRISVNISGHQLADGAFPNELVGILADSGLRSGDLTLELTESVLMGDGETAVLHLERLKQLGVRIAIDDFGTGFSSLNYLHRFPVDSLKIPKPFVERVNRGETRRLAATIVSVGESLRLETIAEGIETVEQRDGLRALGCTLGQGFYFARPMPEAEALEFLTSRMRAAA